MNSTTEVVKVDQITTKRGGRYYDVVRTRFHSDGAIEEDKSRLYSVTTLIGRGLPKPALTRWLQNETARKAVDYAETLVEMKSKGDVEPAIQMLTAFAGAKRDVAGETGTAIHQAIEMLGGARDAADVAAILAPLDDEIRAYVNQFLSFCEDVSPRFLAQEIRCWSEKYGYAGTLDAIAEIGDTVCILDVKTGKQPYPEAALQMASYAHSEYTMSEGDDAPKPTSEWGIEAGYVLHLRPDGWALIETDVSEKVFRMFTYVAQVGGKWAYDMEKDVFGDVREGQA